MRFNEFINIEFFTLPAEIIAKVVLKQKHSIKNLIEPKFNEYYQSKRCVFHKRKQEKLNARNAGEKM